MGQWKISIAAKLEQLKCKHTCGSGGAGRKVDLCEVDCVDILCGKDLISAAKSSTKSQLAQDAFSPDYHAGRQDLYHERYLL
jgi:hypothetical protein